MKVALRARPTMLFSGMLLVALIAFLPLRIALGVIDVPGLSAREVAGPVWWGGLGEARVGKVAIGDMSAGVAPLPLLIGRARVDVDGRARSANEALHGALTFGGSTSGIDKISAHFAAGDTFAPLPITAVDLDEVSVRFQGERCQRAAGRVTATIASAAMPQLSLPQQMRGIAHCADGVLEIPLASTSGTESIALTIRPNGHYRALLTVKPGDAQAASALTGAGFRAVGDGYRLAVTGSF